MMPITLFGLMQRDDFLFDGIGGYDAIDGDGFLLSDAVGAVARLLFDGRVPPRVEMNHIVGGSQVQTQSARLQTDEEERHVPLLECYAGKRFSSLLSDWSASACPPLY